MPAYAPFSLAYWSRGFAGQLLAQSDAFAVSVLTVTCERRSLMTCALNVPRTVETLW